MFIQNYSHDIADKHNLIAFSFGIDQIDRHSVVYKKEFKPSEEELDALRKGQVDVYDRKLKELQEKMVRFPINNLQRKMSLKAKLTKLIFESFYSKRNVIKLKIIINQKQVVQRISIQIGIIHINMQI